MYISDAVYSRCTHTQEQTLCIDRNHISYFCRYKVYLRYKK